MTTRPYTAFVFALALSLPAISSADTPVFSNLGTSPVYDPAGFNFVGNAQDSTGNPNAQADTFAPNITAQFSSVSLALSCFDVGDCPDSFNVILSADDGTDQPGAALESFVVAGTSLDVVSNTPPLTVLTSTLNPTLTSGTQYWISVTAPITDSIAWNWNFTGDSSDQGTSTDGGATWFVSNPVTGFGLTPSAYAVTGTISATPEPGTLPLLFAGSALLALLIAFNKRGSAPQKPRR
jgi:hypothetical protein